MTTEQDLIQIQIETARLSFAFHDGEVQRLIGLCRALPKDSPARKTMRDEIDQQVRHAVNYYRQMRWTEAKQ